MTWPPPALPRRDSAEEQPRVPTATGEFLIRAFRAGPTWAWATVGEVEAAHSGAADRGIRREGKMIEAVPDTLIHPGDTLAVAGDHDELFPLLNAIGEEVDDPELIAFPLESLPVILTCRATDGKTLAESLRTQGRGVSVTRVTRSGRDMPLTRIRKCTAVIRCIWSARSGTSNGAARRSVTRSGRRRTWTRSTSPGHRAGEALIGIPVLSLGGVSVGLGSAGGILLAGLTFGWLRSRHPMFGRFPVPAMWVFEVLGLHLFLAAVGISSGPAFVTGLTGAAPGCCWRAWPSRWCRTW